MPFLLYILDHLLDVVIHDCLKLVSISRFAAIISILVVQVCTGIHLTILCGCLLQGMIVNGGQTVFQKFFSAVSDHHTEKSPDGLPEKLGVPFNTAREPLQ